MKPTPKLHDFAHDACVVGVCISLLSLAGSAVFRSEPGPADPARTDGRPRYASKGSDSTPIELPARALRSRAEAASFVEGRFAGPERITFAGGGLFADSAAEQP